ncbi:MAG: hypothetical protein ACEY3D_01815 [Rickettsia sp.]|uniref:hypothetical protein n=1 Tax=Rickettsia sp. TaxID=789 RepID=UPI00397DCCF4
MLRGPVKPTMSPRGLLTSSIKTIKILIILVFLTGSRGQAYSTEQFLKRPQCRPRESGDPG